MRITRIPSSQELRRKRVAAYCRVSTTQESQEDSFETQVRTYTRYIQENSNWDFVGIYSDEETPHGQNPKSS